MPGSYLNRSWEVSSVPDGTLLCGAGKGNRNPVIYADEKSDISIVPKKLPNKGCMLPGGGDGGKGDSRRECRREPRMPDTEPGKCVEGTRRHTRTRHAIHRNAFASSLAAGAVCSNSASTDLCGGRRATVVPTAIIPIPIVYKRTIGTRRAQMEVRPEIMRI